ncbi:uncharacterized protein L3040_001653 [Drepanopeziza brunnea f. sp. 'multigermtubi']|uniref:uncharacterized protein n=1 Tax=Drepanopeziza brunnea f. sp. 'multigermtubi' TaxID=698441 RepID=UPI0023925528|nr:hypothetical protein L3040_001653 [Drepanopeziza brunnea f. sp. 'multigermtubi']
MKNTHTTLPVWFPEREPRVCIIFWLLNSCGCVRNSDHDIALHTSPCKQRIAGRPWKKCQEPQKKLWAWEDQPCADCAAIPLRITIEPETPRPRSPDPGPESWVMLQGDSESPVAQGTETLWTEIPNGQSPSGFRRMWSESNRPGASPAPTAEHVKLLIKIQRGKRAEAARRRSAVIEAAFESYAARERARDPALVIMPPRVFKDRDEMPLNVAAGLPANARW